MSSDPLPFPTQAELLAASGYPYLPLRVRHRPPLAWHPLRDGEEIARYTYTGLDGEPRFQCIRFHLRAAPGTAREKAFLWRRASGDGGWAWGLDDVELVPYRLARVRAAAAAGERVYVVEGEKDVHALEAMGLAATCNPLGALQWTEAQAEALRGAEVIVIPDQDRAGIVHAARVMASLRGRARSAALLLLPDLERGGDVSDWLARGGDAAELERLAAAAPHDPSPAELASLLNLPRDVDPLATSPQAVRALLTGAEAGADAASPAPHPAFRRSLAAFARLGVTLRPGPASPPEAGVPDAHATYRAVTAAVQGADGDAAERLDDASRLERASYELGMMSALLRAAMAAEPPARPVDAYAADAAFATAPSVRVVRTRWDWEAFLADPSLSAPPDTGPAHVLHLPPSGPLQMRRLHPLPAILLEVCARPQTRAQAAAAVAERVEGDPERIAALVRAQLEELAASGLLLPTAAAPVEATIDEMLRVLTAGAAPPFGARSVLGILSRAVRGTREYADDAVGAYPVHRLDVSVAALEEVLVQARLRGAFSAELDGYWTGPHVHARVRSLSPLLEALDRALGQGAHALPPIVLAQ